MTETLIFIDHKNRVVACHGDYRVAFQTSSAFIEDRTALKSLVTLKLAEAFQESAAKNVRIEQVKDCLE